MEGGSSAGRQDAGAGGERRVGRKAPVGALKQDLSSKTPEEVVDEDGAPEERLGVVDEAHLLQREAQHMGTLLQYRCNSLAVCSEAERRLIFIFNKLPLEVRNPRHRNVIRNSSAGGLLCELLLGAARRGRVRQAGLSAALGLPYGLVRGERRVSFWVQERIHGQDEGHLFLLFSSGGNAPELVLGSTVKSKEQKNGGKVPLKKRRPCPPLPLL